MPQTTEGRLSHGQYERATQVSQTYSVSMAVMSRWKSGVK